MKYERVVVASLNAYGQLLEKLPVDALKENQAIHKEKLVSSSAFWNYSKHKNPQVSNLFSSHGLLHTDNQILLIFILILLF